MVGTGVVGHEVSTLSRQACGKKRYSFVENHVDCLVDKSGDNSCSARIFSSEDNTAGLMCNQAG